ncbi:MAG TPA: PKD domain-containing protein [Solirubrobacteraceae bacterium]|nr:PKD domain-containing protein [Solirubrobacteraceae bacterium]
MRFHEPALSKRLASRSGSVTRSAERRLAALVALGCLALVLACAQQARAVIIPASTIDGPSEEILGFGGVAMAEDGTGGLVYLKRVEGVAHVFVSRYVEGHWLAPIRVDTEQPFAASWPRIAAANGGELVVIWATPFATEHERPVDELLGATLGPGSSSFGRAILVDPNIASGNGTSPDLVMSSTGQADVVYRVVHGGVSTVILRPGDVVEDVRVAHFDGERWSPLGAINRDPGLSMRPPTQVNAPQIAIGPTGNGVVVWQEPEINGVARIWARRLFGATLDFVLPVSAASFNGVPIGDDADAPAVAISRLGQAEVAYRQNVGQGSPLPGPRIFLNTLPDGESVNGSEFLGAGIADAAVPGGASASIGPPSIDIDEKQDLRILYDANGAPRVVAGTDKGLSGSLTLGPGFAGPETSSASVMNPDGGGVSAWPSANAAGQAAVAVREDFPDGAVQTALIGGGAGGEVGELSVGRSGLGDGLVAFRQGPIGHAAIVATQATTPPAPFFLTAPSNWIKPSQAAITWVEATSANGPIAYRIVLDGRIATAPSHALAARLPTSGLDSGVHHVQVLATDIDGQETLSGATTLRIDGQPPTVKVFTSGGGGSVTVKVHDAGVGVETAAIRVSFGDGASGHGKTSFRHRYARGGIYTVVVHVRDKLGNQATVRRLVSVR